MANTLPPRTVRITPKQSLWIDEYMVDLNSARAARAVGYANPEFAGQKLLDAKQFPLVSAEVNKRLAERRAKCEIDSKRIVQELIRIGLANPKRMIQVDGTPIALQDLPDEVAASIQEFKVVTKEVKGPDGEPLTVTTTEIKFWNKLDALKQLAQHLGLLKDVTNNNVLIQAINWDALHAAKIDNPLDPIEDRIAAVERQLPRGEVIDVEVNEVK